MHESNNNTQMNPTGRVCLVDGDKLLLVSNDGSYWYLPGGHMEPRENLAVCAKRELYEETGFEAQIQDIIYVSEFYDKKFDSHKVECIFRAIITSRPDNQNWQDLGHDKSVTMHQWFSLDELQSIVALPAFIKDGIWLKEPKGQIYRGYEESK